MAELAAIGLASNLLQFAELGVKLFQLARESYQSGSTAQCESLRDQARSIQDLAQTTLMLCKSTNSLGMDGLHRTARECEEAVTSLTDLLKKLKVDAKREDKGYKKAWRSVAQALQSVANQDKIKGSERNLLKVRNNLQAYIAVTSLQEQMNATWSLKGLCVQSEKLEARTTPALESIMQKVEDISSSLQGGWVEGVRDRVQSLEAEVSRFNHEKSRVEMQHKILKSLCFGEMKTRQEAIPTNHEATFDWVFDKDRETSSNFPQWLESNDGLFWIRGKPGSGKSTLMKFLAAHEETRSRLQKWAGGNRIAIAAHFFWVGGNSMQKSQRGLIQTLLYKILKEVPDMIESVCRSRWGMFGYARSEPWDEAELEEALYGLITTPQLPTSFCLFIDGLDEYTAGAKRYRGTFEELFETIDKLASMPTVKMCVSSRPWARITDSLSPRVKDWQLKIEDVNQGDIENYVMAILNNIGRHKLQAARDPEFDEIVKTIIPRAQGVFLWVYLVMRSLQNGFVYEDTNEELRDRLDQLPDDLEEYFQHMLDSIGPVYGDSSYRYLKTMVSSDQSIPLLAFEFLDWEAKTPDYAIVMEVKKVSDECLQLKHERLSRRLHARCNDLLDVTNYSVNFFHRTVRDFCADTGAVDKMARKMTASDFNPLLSLCNIMLALSKAREDSVLYGDGLMHFARRAEEQTQKSMSRKDGSSEKAQENLLVLFDILDELDRSFTETLGGPKFPGKAQPKHHGGHWVNFRHRPSQPNLRDPAHKTFLAAAIQAGLSLYVKQKIVGDPSQIRTKIGRPLLDYALRRTMDSAWLSRPTGLEGPTSSIVKLLLENGAEPNERMRPQIGDTEGIKTPWELFLQGCYDHISKGEKIDIDEEEITEAMILMIDHGADWRATAWTEFAPISSRGVIRVLGLSDKHIRRVERSICKAEEREKKKKQGLSSFFGGLLPMLWGLLWLEKEERRAVCMRLLVCLRSLVGRPAT